MTKEVRDYLKKPSFDNWQWDDAEMIMLLRQMFIDLGLVVKFNIEVTIIGQTLLSKYFAHRFVLAFILYHLYVGRGGSVVGSGPCVREVTGLKPTLATTPGP